MKRKKLICLIAAALICSSCQQAQLGGLSPLTENTATSEQSTTSSEPNRSAAQESENLLQAENDSISDQKTNITDDESQVDGTEKESDSDQNKIDQALDLCNYAQTMWEKGNLDEALSSLDSAYYQILQINHSMSADLNQQKEDVRYLISKRILEIYASRQIVVTGRREAIPIALNEHVNAEIKRLTGPERNFFINALERSSQYRPFIVQELKKAGLPTELSWLPLIESGFKIRALSSARALGLWQFIPSTGHKFGLSRNYYIDERMDPEKSTKAAIAYLKELHNLFGDWTTSLAAYNCGEFRVLKTIRRQKINYLDNFWDLYQSLPMETARYVPRFLATVHIVQNLQEYGITIENSSPVAFKTFDIKKQVRLKDIAKELGIKTTQLESLNPELRHGILPPEAYKLKVPQDKADLFLAKLDQIKATSYTPPAQYVYHRVRKGETISGIARKYHTSIRAISRCNNIGRAYRIIAGKVLKIPSRNGAMINDTASSTQEIPAGKTVKYTVRKGDSLWIIAKEFSVTTKQIMQLNGLSSATLHIGQSLKITSSSPQEASSGQRATYRVKSGDSPFLIAKRHNMTLNRLLSLNQLSRRSKIYPGQQLIVE